MKDNLWTQITKYGIIGVINTLLTAIVIWVMMYLVFRVGKEENISPLIVTVSNATGFVAGLLNSFFWNWKWTFHSGNRWKSDFIRFIIAFLACFIPQLFLVNFLNTRITGISYLLAYKEYTFTIAYSYICQLIGIFFYSTLNFALNKYYTFNSGNLPRGLPHLD